MGGTAWASVIIVMAIRRGRGHIEQTSTERELVGAMGVGEEAVVANAMETVRQHVEQEAPHELADVEAHDFALETAVLPIVRPAETDIGLVKIEQAAVSDRDAMRVAREIGQDLLGTGEGLFSIDDPFGPAQWCEQRSELVYVLESGEIGKEL